MKRGQLLGLPLVLVFALIVGAFILLYGIKVVIDLQEQGDYVALAEWVQDIDTRIDTFAEYDVGSAKKLSINLPSDVETICFYDPQQAVSCMYEGAACSVELQEDLELVLGEQYRAYIFPLGVYDQSRFRVAAFKAVGGNPVCVANGGTVRLVALEDGVGVEYV